MISSKKEAPRRAHDKEREFTLDDTTIKGDLMPEIAENLSPVVSLLPPFLFELRWPVAEMVGRHFVSGLSPGRTEVVTAWACVYFLVASISPESKRPTVRTLLSVTLMSAAFHAALV